MATARLTWQTPTGAVLWELWSRQRKLFITQGIVLLAGAVLVHWLANTPGNLDFFGPIAYQAGALALLQTLACFCYMEVDSRRLQGGIPGYLFLKPLTTTRLVTIPMICGGAAVVGALLAWVGLILRHVGFPVGHLFWICGVLFSFTWCVQAVVWSSANLNWGVQTVLVLLTAGVHLLLGLMPIMPVEIPGVWRMAMIVMMLAGAFSLAKTGVERIRKGTWEGNGGAQRTQIHANRKIKAFGSAFSAQFWLEWRRQGLRLPLFTGLGLLFFILMEAAFQFAFRGQEPDAMPDDASWLFLNYMVVTPLVCSLVLGGLISKFDLSQPGNEMPVFVAIRPMTNCGFVLAKLAMAAVSSLATWLVFGGALVFWLILCGHGALVWRTFLSKPAALVVMLIPSFFVCVLLTWRNLVAGIWLGLTGRPFFIGGADWLRFPAYLAIASLAFRAKDHPEFRAALFDWLPWILAACLVVKLLISAAAFQFGLRRKAITRGTISWIVGGWLGCGLFVALIAHRICLDVHAPQAWLWIALVGFWLLPLAELALAPLALALNRHR